MCNFGRLCGTNCMDLKGLEQVIMNYCIQTSNQLGSQAFQTPRRRKKCKVDQVQWNKSETSTVNKLLKPSFWTTRTVLQNHPNRTLNSSALLDFWKMNFDFNTFHQKPMMRQWFNRTRSFSTWYSLTFFPENMLAEDTPVQGASKTLCGIIVPAKFYLLHFFVERVHFFLE